MIDLLETEVAGLRERVMRLEARSPASPQEDPLLSQERAAAVIGVKPPTLATWRHQGKGPKYVKVGRAAFYRPADIEAWLDEQVVIPIPRGSREPVKKKPTRNPA